MILQASLFAILTSSASALVFSAEPKNADGDLEAFGKEMEPASRDAFLHGIPWREVASRRAEAMKSLRNQSIVFYGDSLAEHWSGDQQGLSVTRLKNRAKLWKRMFGDRYGAAHVSGIGGDRIGNLLWRLQNGESPIHAQPRLIMLNIGTNDIEYGWMQKHNKIDPKDAAEKMFEGIKNVVELFDKESPSSQILLNAVLPRSSAWPKGPYSKVIPELNRLIEGLADQKTIHYSDCSNVLLKHGKISQDYSLDFLHPNDAGAARWGQCLQPTIDRILLQ